MTMTIRNTNGRYENAERAFQQAKEDQRDQLILLFRSAGLDPRPLLWGHSGTMSLNSLAALVNHAIGHRRIPEVHPSDFAQEL